MHTQINEVPVRIEKVALLSSPNRFTQVTLLLTLSKQGIACRLSGSGDVEVSSSFISDLVREEYIEDGMGDYLSKGKIDKVVFIDNMVTR